MISCQAIAAHVRLPQVALPSVLTGTLSSMCIHVASNCPTHGRSISICCLDGVLTTVNVYSCLLPALSEMDPHADPPAVETTPLLGLPQETKIPTIMPMKYRACIPAADLVSSWTHSKHTRALIGDIWRGTEVIRKGFANDPVQAGYFGVRLRLTPSVELRRDNS